VRNDQCVDLAGLVSVHRSMPLLDPHGTGAHATTDGERGPLEPATAAARLFLEPSLTTCS
jgi:hypothetical protein